MTLTQLNAFVLVARLGSVTAAANALGVSESAVSQALSALRLHLGDQLVARGPVGMTLTAGGSRLLATASQIVVLGAEAHAAVRAAQGAPGWEGQNWANSLNVPMTTLDLLIERHGSPRFIKIDVEGLEEEVLQGLSHPIKALSFEFTTIQRQVALACIDRCVTLGFSRFNVALGESQTFVHADWLDGTAIRQWLLDVSHDANSGDVYAISG